MKRHFFWAMVIGGSALFGGVLATHQASRAGTPAAAETGDQEENTDLVDQVRELKTQVKEINTLLHSGTLRVVVVMNPPPEATDDK